MDQTIGPPPAFHLLLEGRVGLEAAETMLRMPLLRMQLPRGTGDVMVIPGFMADDSATWILRRLLTGLGYQVFGWGLGRNRGPMFPLLEQLVTRLIEAREKGGGAASLVGWSRGGVFAREIARDRPDLVRSIVTLGSPVRGGLYGTRVGAWVTRSTGVTAEQVSEMQRQRNRAPICVPITAIYSRSDGVVGWEACIDRISPDIVHEEIESSHMGLVVNSTALRKVAEALARHHCD